MQAVKKDESPWIGFDLDEVLANLRDPMSEGMTRMIGKPIHWHHWDDYNFFEAHTTLERFLQMIVDEGCCRVANPKKRLPRRSRG